MFSSGFWWRWVMIHKGSIDQFIFRDFVNKTLISIKNNPTPNNADYQRILCGIIYLCTRLPMFHQLCMIPPLTIIFSLWIVHHIVQCSNRVYFCELASELSRRCNQNWTNDIMRVEIRNIYAMIERNGSLFRTYQHCGYPYN